MKRFSAILLLVLTLPALGATPPLGQDIPVAPLEYGEPLTEKSHIGIASNGDSYFVVWGERRSGYTSEVFGARVAADGTLLDRTSISLGREGFRPVVTAMGSRYVVAWPDQHGIQLAAIEANGMVSARNTIVQRFDYTGDLTIATNGDTILLAHVRKNALLINRDLQLVREIPLTIDPSTDTKLAIATAGSTYLLATVDRLGSLYTQTIDGAGAISEPLNLVAGTFAGARGVSVASDGNTFFVVYSANMHFVARQLVTKSNEAIGAPAAFSPASGTVPFEEAPLGAPAVAWRGNEYVVTYSTHYGDHLYLVRAAANGTAISEPVRYGQDVTAERQHIAVRADGSGAVAWLDRTLAVKVGLFDSMSLTEGKPFTKAVGVAVAAREHRQPRVERFGATQVIAWIEQAVGFNEIRLSRGSGTPIVVASNANATWLDIATDGETLFVVWANPDGAWHVRRYGAGLQPIDAAPLNFPAPAKLDPEQPQGIAAGEGRLLVLWRGWEQKRKLTAVLLKPENGTLVRAPELALGAEHDADGAFAIWDGTQFMVLWREQPVYFGSPPIPVDGSLQAYHVTKDGQRVESSPLVLIERLLPYTGLVRGAREEDGTLLVAWQDFESQSLWAARYDGTLPLTPKKVGPAPYSVPIDWELMQIVPLPNGDVDFWWADVSIWPASGALRYERVPGNLEATGDYFVIEQFGVSTAWTQFDATHIRGVPVLVYARTTDEAGGVARVQLKRGDSIRRRSVR
ncbi:MAG: hypothetical protein ACLGH0_06355 [Thermoanaerobaculia bacterium]